MSNRFNWKDGVGAVLFVLLVAGGLINSVAAANTHSIDLEHSSSQYASISDGSQTGLDITGDMTIALYVKPESQPSNERYVLVSKSDCSGGCSNQSYILSYQDVSGTKKINLILSDDGTGVGEYSVNYTLNNDTWYHVTAEFNSASNKMDLYVNGSYVGSDDKAGSKTTYNSSAPFKVGSDDGAYGTTFDGLIDELRIWSRNLSAGEIDDLYTAPETFSNGSNLGGWWKFDNDYTDSSGNGNTLTPSNSPVFSSDVPFDSVPPPPPPATEDLSAYKNTNESVTNSTSLQSDDQLELSLGANKVYTVEGVIFISSTKAKPDAKISFNADPDTAVMLGYLTNKDGSVLTDGSVSPRIVLPANIPVPVFIKGTVSTGAESTSLELLWAQSTSNSAATTVLKGSYLRATEL